jgi:hypothetical protein
MEHSWVHSIDIRWLQCNCLESCTRLINYNIIIFKMEVIEKKDLLKLKDDTFVRSILTPHGKSLWITDAEEVYFSCTLSKFNRYGFKQDRTLLITNLHMFNLTKQSKDNWLFQQRLTEKLICLKWMESLFVKMKSIPSLLFTSKENMIIGNFILSQLFRYVSPNLRDTIVTMVRRITRNKGH